MSVRGLERMVVSEKVIRDSEVLTTGNKAFEATRSLNEHGSFWDAYATWNHEISEMYQFGLAKWTWQLVLGSPLAGLNKNKLLGFYDCKNQTYSIHGTGIFTYIYHVNIHVGEYISPMDGMGEAMVPCNFVFKQPSKTSSQPPTNAEQRAASATELAGKSWASVERTLPDKEDALSNMVHTHTHWSSKIVKKYLIYESTINTTRTSTQKIGWSFDGLWKSPCREMNHPQILIPCPVDLRLNKAFFLRTPKEAQNYKGPFPKRSSPLPTFYFLGVCPTCRGRQWQPARSPKWVETRFLMITFMHTKHFHHVGYRRVKFSICLQGIFY